jgi:hypothetical protein
MHSLKQIRTFGLSLAAAAVFATGSAPRPAAANTTSTITTIAGVAAVIGGIILYNNYQHKQQAANQVVGYTRNGGSILGDGRIVMPNAQTYYPNANGQYPSGQYAYYANGFNGNAVAYDTSRSGQFDRTHHHDNGLHRGWYKNGADAHVNAYAPQRRVERHEDRNQGDHHDQRDEHDHGGNGNGNGHGHD